MAVRSGTGLATIRPQPRAKAEGEVIPIVLVPRSRRARFSRLRRPLASGLAALVLCAGTLVLVGMLDGLQLGAGAAAPTPTLYVNNYTGNTVLNFPLSATGNVAPAAIVSNDGSGSVAQPWGEVLDVHGNLWVGNYSGSISEFTPSQLASSGTPAPAVALQDPGGPSGLVFDSNGDLWVTHDGTGGVVEFSASQLTSSGTPTPAVSLTGSQLADPVGLTFDAAGDLWVASRSGGQLLEFTPAQLAASGSPTPAVTISGLGSTRSPTFDAKGDLWVLVQNGLVELTPGQLAVSGSPTPAVTIGGLTNPVRPPVRHGGGSLAC